MTEAKQITLPITGMYCANCVSTIERNLKKVDGVQNASVNLSSERATVQFDPAKAGLGDMVARVQRAGYGIATGTTDLVLKHLSDANDAHRLESAVRDLEGVLAANVSLSTDRVRVVYVPTIVGPTEIRKAVTKAGFEVLDLEGAGEDAEAKARLHEIAVQRRLLISGLIFTIPLFLLAMGGDLGLLPRGFYWMPEMSSGMSILAPWVIALMWAVATPVQFFVGWQYYVGAYKSLRAGSANMDVLIAMGSDRRETAL